MEDTGIINLKKELKLKKFQFDSIFEFSETIYSAFDIDSIIRIYFSTLMGQLGLTRLFFYDSRNKILEKRGFRISEGDKKNLEKGLKKLGNDWFTIKVDDLVPDDQGLQELLKEKKIHQLINISESSKNCIVLGVSLKFNKLELSNENVDLSFFVSKFSLSAIDNAFMINRLIESKRVEHEMKIARDIQLALLPQEIPALENFEIGVIYQPINEVGGDYYDILNERGGMLPILIADVEGKGLSAALLAASSQAIFRSMNELYFFSIEKFVSKANALIYDFTRGNRFITLCWMLLDDCKRTITYVNAGHVAPMLISDESVTLLEKGGFLTGFISEAQYEQDTVQLKPGDLVVAFTDGVNEVENNQGEEFGDEAVIAYLRDNQGLPASQMASGLFAEIKKFSGNKKFRDDFTLIIIKAK